VDLSNLFGCPISEELVELLADDMEKEDLQARTLTLKLKETGFEVSNSYFRSIGLWLELVGTM
jgi:hypothetical protein